MKEPNEKARSYEHYAILLIALLGFPVAVVLGRYLEPDARGVGTHEQLGFEPCWMMAELDLPCPGCGVTTSVSLASRGDLWGSFANQPFGFLLVVLSLAAFLWAVVSALRGRDLWLGLAKLRFWTWAAPLGFALLVSWAYKVARIRGWF